MKYYQHCMQMSTKFLFQNLQISDNQDTNYWFQCTLQEYTGTHPQKGQDILFFAK